MFMIEQRGFRLHLNLSLPLSSCASLSLSLPSFASLLSSFSLSLFLSLSLPVFLSPLHFLGSPPFLRLSLTPPWYGFISFPTFYFPLVPPMSWNLVSFLDVERR